MGSKGAPSYFQQMMATIALAGIIFAICEVDIDDEIVHGTDEKSFVNNLRSVFERLRKYKVTLNPKKRKIGLGRIEFIGNELDAEKMSFSSSKKNDVLDFPRPTTGKQLRQFLEITN